MANPYAGGGTAGAALASARGDMGDGNGGRRDADLDASSISLGRVVRSLWRYVRPHAVSLVASFVCSAASVLLQLYVPILIGQAIDCMVAAGRVDLVALLPVLHRLAAAVAVAAASQWVAGYCTNRLSSEAVRDLRDEAFDKLETLPLSFVDAHSHGDLLARVVSDADLVGDGLLQGMTQLFGGVVQIAGTLAFMVSLSLPVALVVVALTPLSALAATAIARKGASSFAAQQEIQGELAGFAEEVVSNHRSSLTNPSTRLVNNFVYAAVAVVGCACVIGGWPSALTVGQVQSFLSYSNQYMKPFNEVSAVATQLSGALASARRLLALLDAADEEPDAADAVSLDDPAGALELDHVSFSYDPAKPLLKDICLSIRPGQRFALVGPTGCGKTTLINLLLRFYDADAGTISLDGHDVRDLTRASLRSAFGMVLQDSWLFRGTVRDNIAYGSPGATADDVVRAAREARAHEFITQLPDGYETVVGEGGLALSQGQRQLLCIARVMLCDPAVLLLDEATSSIDTRTELRVQQAFDRMMRGRTSLVVAHRLSTVREADCIVVMDAGRVVEKGTHDELLAKGGAYARLYESQFAQ